MNFEFGIGLRFFTLSITLYNLLLLLIKYPVKQNCRIQISKSCVWIVIFWPIFKTRSYNLHHLNWHKNFYQNHLKPNFLPALTIYAKSFFQGLVWIQLSVEWGQTLLAINSWDCDTYVLPNGIFCNKWGNATSSSSHSPT